MINSPESFSEIVSSDALKEMADMLAKSECENLKLKKLLKEANGLISLHKGKTLLKKVNDAYLASEICSDYRIELHE